MTFDYDTEQDRVKIASHTNLAYSIASKSYKKLSCKLPDVPKYYIKWILLGQVTIMASLGL